MTGEDVAAAAQLACLLEVSAAKPGNVCPGRDFHDTRYEDFLASAVAIAPAMAVAGERPLGVTIRSAVEATGRWTRSNTNLGIVLLLAPLARAARAARTGRGALRQRLAGVLAETTLEDAAETYAAIRRAHPGGLGRASAEDVTRSQIRHGVASCQSALVGAWQRLDAQVNRAPPQFPPLPEEARAPLPEPH